MVSVKSSLVRYCRILLRKSLITGIPQIIMTKGYARKIVKTVVFLLCVSGFLYQTTAFLKVYWTYPTVVYVMTSFPSIIYQPAISICSYNGINSTQFCERFPDYCSPIRNITEFCSVHNEYCNEFMDISGIPKPAVLPHRLPQVPRSVYKEMGTSADKLIEDCQIIIGNRSSSCLKKITWVPVYGVNGLPTNCYSINSRWGSVSEKQDIIGRKTVISLDVKGLKEDMFYSRCPEAVQVAIHSSFAMVNPFRDGFLVKRCRDYYVYVSKVTNRLLPPPYTTNCTHYLKLWKSRGGKGPLNRRMCTEECAMNVSISENNCTDPYSITYPNAEHICKSPINDEKVFIRCSRQCQSACYFDDINTIVEEHRFERQMKSKDSATCTTRILINFDRMEETKYTYYAKYESIELFSYIGGYLGMWLGLSLVAVFDFLETVSLLFCFCFRKARKRKKSTEGKIPLLFIKRIHNI